MVTAELGCGGGRRGSGGGASPRSMLVHMAIDVEIEVRLYPPCVDKEKFIRPTG